ncbi:MAG: GguC protein [Alphaproteobacteria bacterium]|nr:MAG: GguC protein [Alphaproteobacteria bacterium]
MLLSQVKHKGAAAVVARELGSAGRIVKNAQGVYELALEAADQSKPLTDVIREHGLGDSLDLERAYAAGDLLSPIGHPNPANLHLTGTGLTHLGSAATRDAMHKNLAEKDKETLTDSMKIFRMGLEGGKPQPGQIGVQPEWFYKGNGATATGPGEPLMSPGFALDGGEEPEVAGIYVIASNGMPFRIGFTLSNEFSDHVTERMNYLYLAHSKLRPASFGPEIRVGAPPADIRGMSRIKREGKVIWEKPFLSGEANMSHTFANLEHHHFKYRLFRQPGDVHIHMFGTATLSFADGIKAEEGDVFEIECAEFGLPLRNPLKIAKEPAVTVRVL